MAILIGRGLDLRRKAVKRRRRKRRLERAEAAESAKGRDGRFGRVNVCGSTLLCSFEGAGSGASERAKLPCGKFPVTIAGGHHLYPYRTQKLSLQTLMVLSWERLGRVGSCRDPRGAGGTKVFPAPKHKEERGGERKPEASEPRSRGKSQKWQACAKAKKWRKQTESPEQTTATDPE